METEPDQATAHCALISQAAEWDLRLLVCSIRDVTCPYPRACDSLSTEMRDCTRHPTDIYSIMRAETAEPALDMVKL
eukprot:superscaffoldBa00000419_g4598